MNKREFAKLQKYTDTLTDEELKKEYYDALYDSLGSQTEEMYERGYDIADILEREKHEKWHAERTRGFGKAQSGGAERSLNQPRNPSRD